MELKAVPLAVGTTPSLWDRAAFREAAIRAMSARFQTTLAPARLHGHPIPFDLVSEDRTLIGCVIAPSARRTNTMSSAERAELSETILLLTSTPAQQRVLVVGHDRARLAPWLAVYGHLAREVEFWQLDAAGRLERMLTS